MKKLLITTLFTIVIATNSQAASTDIAVNNVSLSNSYTAYSLASNTATSSSGVYINTGLTSLSASGTASSTSVLATNSVATSTASSTWDIEVDNNYSEILGLNDCKVLGKRVFQRIEKINDKIEIRVKDNGNGIPQKVLDKIFQPFFTTKPTGQGTGLGLSMSYDIIKAHGGELKVETKEGEFAEFIISLPV